MAWSRRGFGRTRLVDLEPNPIGRSEGRFIKKQTRSAGMGITAVAMITETESGRSALCNVDLMDSVRKHNLIALRQAWKKFEEAVPGQVKLVPQWELRMLNERDYEAMQDMILGDIPDFRWIVDLLTHAEAIVNGTTRS